MALDQQTAGTAVPQPVPQQPAPRRRYLLNRLDRKVSPYLFIAPFFVVFGIFGLFPALYTFWVSLHEWDLISGTDGDHAYVGFDNYRELFGDEYFWNALGNTVGIFVIATIPQLLMALGLAHLLHGRMRGRTFFRMGVLLPNITSIAAVALIFSQLFGRDYGLINWLLGQDGWAYLSWPVGLLDPDPVNWQAHKWSSWLAIAVMVDWRWTGYNALIYLAALQAVPRDLYESAALDGAGRMRQFWHVTVPMLRPTIVFTVIVATIGGMQLFAEPLLFDSQSASANGGAGRQFQTLALYLYQKAFRNFDFGYASTIAWVLFGVVLVMAVLNLVIVRRLAADR